MAAYFDEARLDDERALGAADPLLRGLAESGARVRREAAEAKLVGVQAKFEEAKANLERETAEMRERLNTDVADIANAKIGSTAGGMLLAGVFLREFVGSTKAGAKPQAWAHLDIAGTANNEGAAYGYTPKGATGVALRTLVTVAEGMSR